MNNIHTKYQSYKVKSSREVRDQIKLLPVAPVMTFHQREIAPERETI